METRELRSSQPMLFHRFGGTCWLAGSYRDDPYLRQHEEALEREYRATPRDDRLRRIGRLLDQVGDINNAIQDYLDEIAALAGDR